MFYKILPDKGTSGKISVSKKTFTKRAFVNMDSFALKAGSRKEYVKVTINHNLKEDELLISTDTLKALSIPSDIIYQIKLEKNMMKIGPLVGLLTCKSSDFLTKGRLNSLLDYSIIYPDVHGLLIAFSVEDINFDSNLVNGYYYNLDAENKGLPWKKGVFPIPDSIYQRTNVPESVRVRLKKETSNRLFNSNYFNKWEFYTMISKYKGFYGCIPDTRLLSSLEDIDYMLSNYTAAYLKPSTGTLSRGLYKVTKDAGEYIFKDNVGNDINKCSTKEEAENYINNIIRKHQYLVQQAIRPLRTDGRHQDFRVIMQKDDTLAWTCTGIIGLVGRRGDICTNWGYVSTLDDLLTKGFNFSQQQIFKVQQEIIAGCKSVCEMLDLTGENYGDLGFDVVLDENLKVWVLEVNKRHYHTVPLWMNDKQTFYEIKAKAIKYSVALAGFSVY